MNELIIIIKLLLLLLLLLSYDEHVSIDSLHVMSLLACWGLTTKDSPLAPIVSSTNMATTSLSFEPLGIYMYCKGSTVYVFHFISS